MTKRSDSLILSASMESPLRYLSVAVLLTVIGCSRPISMIDNSAADGRADSSVAADLSKPWGGLEVQFSGVPLEKAEQIVVLMHGYGAPASDLVPLAPLLSGKSRGFVFPAAPTRLRDGGRDWGLTEAEFNSSLKRVAALITHVASTYPNAKISVGGFSQGATISSMLLLESSLPLQNAILYSPARKFDKVPMREGNRPRVLLAHGRRDEVLPFADSERLRDLLEGAGYDVNWRPFNGGHTLTNEVLDATRRQLDDNSPSD